MNTMRWYGIVIDLIFFIIILANVSPWICALIFCWGIWIYIYSARAMWEHNRANNHIAINVKAARPHAQLAANKDEWMKRAQAQYIRHGVSEEKAFLWAQSRWHNVDKPLSKEPEAVAEDDLLSWE